MLLKKYLLTCNEVYHTTLDPRTPGVCRIHLVPPKKLKPNIPWVCIINGYSIIPLNSAWGVLLKEFIGVINEYDNKEALSDEDIKLIADKTVKKMKSIFPTANKEYFLEDLKDMIKTFKNLAIGKAPDAKIGYMSLSKYGKYMSAPHRMDLMVSAMEKNGCWNCNQKCLHCYAANELMSSKKELSLEEWKIIIDKCKSAMIPSLTFTGGEATIRSDLVEMIAYSKWFVTRLNTNGILLSKDLCKRLKEASLDSVQVTLYSDNKKIHNLLVGGDHFDQTIQGIKNAIEAGLDVSINTPLCSLNNDYAKTVAFGHSLGIHYFSSSGLIPTGNAKNSNSKITKLSKEEITSILKEAYNYALNNDCELSFTSPGWIDEKDLKEMRIVVPSCGACLSNMAITPNGEVIPCQSWLNGKSFGNLLSSNWKDIWENKECKKVRELSIKSKEVCLLKEEK